MSNTTQTLLFLAGAFLFFLSCESGSNSEKEDKTVDPYAHSEAIYQEACASCHGVMIAAFADRKWEYGSEKDSIVEVITAGLPEEDMPGYDSVYSAAAIDSLADYILTIKEKVDYYKFEGADDSTGVFAAEAYDLRIDTVVTGLKSPWGLAFLPDGDILVSDKSGVLYRVNENGEKTEIEGVPEVVYAGQGGLMDVRLHPDFENNNWVYLSYSKGKKEGDEEVMTTAINRAKLDGNEALMTFATTLERVIVETVESGSMTKDLALLVGPDQGWLTTMGFLEKIDENLNKALAG